MSQSRCRAMRQTKTLQPTLCYWIHLTVKAAYQQFNCYDQQQLTPSRFYHVNCTITRTCNRHMHAVRSTTHVVDEKYTNHLGTEDSALCESWRRRRNELNRLLKAPERRGRGVAVTLLLWLPCEMAICSSMFCSSLIHCVTSLLSDEISQSRC